MCRGGRQYTRGLRIVWAPIRQRSLSGNLGRLCRTIGLACPDSSRRSCSGYNLRRCRLAKKRCLQGIDEAVHFTAHNTKGVQHVSTRYICSPRSQTLSHLFHNLDSHAVTRCCHHSPCHTRQRRSRRTCRCTMKPPRLTKSCRGILGDGDRIQRVRDHKQSAPGRNGCLATEGSSPWHELSPSRLLLLG